MRQDEFPILVLDDSTVKDTDNVEAKCEEILQSRKSECYGEANSFDMNAFLSIPNGIPPYRWYFCMLKCSLPLSCDRREVLRDCQLLLEIVVSDKCQQRCDKMNATEQIEYLCSCHPKTKKVGVWVHSHF